VLSRNKAELDIDHYFTVISGYIRLSTTPEKGTKTIGEKYDADSERYNG
jgi:hypothetical protein